MFKDLLVQAGLSNYEASCLCHSVKLELEQEYDTFECSGDLVEGFENEN